MDDRIWIRIALIAVVAAVLLFSLDAAGWLGRGYESLAGVAVAALVIGIVSGGIALALRPRRDVHSGP